MTKLNLLRTSFICAVLELRHFPCECRNQSIQHSTFHLSVTVIKLSQSLNQTPVLSPVAHFPLFEDKTRVSIFEVFSVVLLRCLVAWDVTRRQITWHSKAEKLSPTLLQVHMFAHPPCCYRTCSLQRAESMRHSEQLCGRLGHCCSQHDAPPSSQQQCLMTAGVLLYLALFLPHSTLCFLFFLPSPVHMPKPSLALLNKQIWFAFLRAFCWRFFVYVF
jgi:hypothetical protein